MNRAVPALCGAALGCRNWILTLTTSRPCFVTPLNIVLIWIEFGALSGCLSDTPRVANWSLVSLEAHFKRSRQSIRQCCGPKVVARIGVVYFRGLVISVSNETENLEGLAAKPALISQPIKIAFAFLIAIFSLNHNGC
jgi:hypothetical protein